MAPEIKPSYWPPVFAMISDGWMLSGDGAYPAHPALVPGLQLKVGGQPSNIPIPSATAAPAALVLTDGGAAATPLLAGFYDVRASYTTAEGETVWGPQAVVQLAANGNKIHVAAIGSVPAAVITNGIKVYFKLTVNGITYGLCSTPAYTTGSGTCAAFDITTAGDGVTFPPMANEFLGKLALPVIAGAATGVVTITNSLITAKSIIEVDIEYGMGTLSSALLKGKLVAQASRPGAGSCNVDVTNNHATQTTALNDFVLVFKIWQPITG